MTKPEIFTCIVLGMVFEVGVLTTRRPVAKEPAQEPSPFYGFNIVSTQHLGNTTIYAAQQKFWGYEFVIVTHYQSVAIAQVNTNK